jgi:hypothetical protein
MIYVERHQDGAWMWINPRHVVMVEKGPEEGTLMVWCLFTGAWIIKEQGFTFREIRGQVDAANAKGGDAE